MAVNCIEKRSRDVPSCLRTPQRLRRQAKVSRQIETDGSKGRPVFLWLILLCCQAAQFKRNAEVIMHEGADDRIKDQGLFFG